MTTKYLYPLSDEQRQRELPLPPPFETGDLIGRESRGAFILAQPKFSWMTGKWTALTNVDGMLALCEYNITRKVGE